MITHLVNEETRHAVSGFNSSPGNILDLVLSNDNNFVFYVCVDVPFSTSDHLVVKFDIMFNVNTQKSCSKRFYDFKNVNWSDVELHLSSVDFYLFLTPESLLKHAPSSFMIRYMTA